MRADVDEDACLRRGSLGVVLHHIDTLVVARLSLVVKFCINFLRYCAVAATQALHVL